MKKIVLGFTSLIIVLIIGLFSLVDVKYDSCNCSWQPTFKFIKKTTIPCAQFCPNISEKPTKIEILEKIISDKF